MAELINPSSYNDFTLQTLMTPDGITRLNSLLSQLSQNIAGDTESVRVFQGVGTPEASVAAGVGSLYMRTDGGTDTSLYRKESGSGDTGWVAVKAPATLPLSVANGGLGADNSSGAQGSTLYFSATGTISVLGPGTSGQFLKTQGAAANPIWSNLFASYTAGDYFTGGTFKVGINPTSTTPTKVLEVFIPRAGTLRIKFHLDGSAGTCNGQIYRNGSTVGTLRSNAAGTGTNYSEDISGWAAGDLCQLYVYNSSAANNTYGASLLLYEGTPITTIVNDVTYPVSKMYTGSVDPTTLLNDLGAVGDLYLNTGGGAATTLYVKTAATTWTAK